MTLTWKLFLILPDRRIENEGWNYNKRRAHTSVMELNTEQARVCSEVV